MAVESKMQNGLSRRVLKYDALLVFLDNLFCTQCTFPLEVILYFVEKDLLDFYLFE